MTVKPPAPPPLPDELDRLLRRLRMPYVRRAAPEVIATATSQRWEHAEVLQSAARRGGRRPRPGDDLDAPPRVGPAGRQNVRRLGARRLDHPDPDADRAANAGMGQPRRSPRRVRPAGSGKIAFHRGARASRDRQRPHRLLAHTRFARRAVPPPPRRRQHQQSDQQTDPLRSNPDRRCRAVARSQQTPPTRCSASSTPPTRNARSRSAPTSTLQGSTN